MITEDPDLPDSREGMLKHELIPCERCGKRVECKANSYTNCQCAAVQLNLNETQYISERYDGCLCAACLLELKWEYACSIDPAATRSAIVNS